jgi:hypothetical protein
MHLLRVTVIFIILFYLHMFQRLLHQYFHLTAGLDRFAGNQR